MPYSHVSPVTAHRTLQFGICLPASASHCPTATCPATAATSAAAASCATAEAFPEHSAHHPVVVLKHGRCTYNTEGASGPGNRARFISNFQGNFQNRVLRSRVRFPKEFLEIRARAKAEPRRRQGNTSIGLCEIGSVCQQSTTLDSAHTK
jgi:hypothetical protein